MTGGDERFYAWLDGELRGDEAAAMEARVAKDPELARIAREDRQLKATLSGAFGDVAEAPVPSRLQDALTHTGQGATIVDLSARVRDRGRPRTIIPQWARLAASLAIGVFIGATALNQPGDTPVTELDGKLYAAAGLEAGLNKQLASTPAESPVQIGITYRERSGTYCRTFTVSGSTGLACHDNGRWRVEAMLAATEGSLNEYRMAGGLHPVLAELIAPNIAGEPLDAAAERAARERGWVR